jgi:hypothetical protein
MIQIFALLLICGTLVARDAGAPHNIPQVIEPFFENEIIHKLDGAKIGTVTYGIDGPTIHDMLWLLQKMNGIVMGHKNEAGVLVKKYLFEDKPCTLHELYKIEKTLSDKAVEEKRQALLKSCRGETPVFKQRWQEVEQQRAHQLAEIQKTLAVIRKDFEVTTTAFMMQVNIFKSLICQLIEEWCVRTKRQDTFLLTWHQAEGDVFGLFHKEITSAQKLLQFMADLKDFLTKLVHSCPRAWKEFVENQEVYLHHIPTKPSEEH